MHTFDAYVALPYSKACPAEKVFRFELANKYTARLLKQGLKPFSPITHSHPLRDYDVGTEWKHWQEYDEHVLRACKEIHVLMLPGWQDSVGLAAELKLAQEEGIRIVWIKIEDIWDGYERTSNRNTEGMAP